MSHCPLASPPQSAYWPLPLNLQTTMNCLCGLRLYFFEEESRVRGQSENNALRRKFQFQMIIKMEEARKMLQAITKLFLRAAKDVPHKLVSPSLTRTTLRGQSICPAALSLSAQNALSKSNTNTKPNTKHQRTTNSEENVTWK